MINMQMAEQHHIELGHFRAALTEPKSATATRIDSNPGLSILPDQIAAGSPFILQLRSAGPKHLNCDTLFAAILRIRTRAKCVG
jgi:hypothetical protein